MNDPHCARIGSTALSYREGLTGRCFRGDCYLSTQALVELGRVQAPAAINGEQVHDLSYLLWASIDTDDFRDLDQLTVAEAMLGDKVRVLVVVTEVDELVNEGSAIDENAGHDATSVHTAGKILPMLPEKRSTDTTSLDCN